MRECPYCAEEIQVEAVKCRHCGSWLNTEEAKQLFANQAQEVSREPPPQVREAPSEIFDIQPAVAPAVPPPTIREEGPTPEGGTAAVSESKVEEALQRAHPSKDHASEIPAPSKVTSQAAKGGSKGKLVAFGALGVLAVAVAVVLVVVFSGGKEEQKDKAKKDSKQAATGVSTSNAKEKRPSQTAPREEKPKDEPAERGGPTEPDERPSEAPTPPEKGVLPPGTKVGRMVLLKDGCFEMGRQGQDPDEVPVHRVCMVSFYMDLTEVTVEDYSKCTEAGVCGRPKAYGTEEEWQKQCNFGADGKDGYPVNCVTWLQAKTFCSWAGKRLPSEAEWEYAARGTQNRMYPWGSEMPTCERVVMANADGSGCSKGHTWPVGSKPLGATPEGIVDLAGNVWEWVEDCHDSKAYSRCGTDCRNPKHACDSGDRKRVIRGSAFTYGEDKATSFRTSLRGFYKPKAVGQGIGFRCAKDGNGGGGTTAGVAAAKVVRVSASSHLARYKDHTFVPANVIDGRLDTSWQPRGSKTDSVGEWVMLSFDRSYQVTTVEIANGYQRTGGDVDLFLANSRVNAVRLEFSDGSTQAAKLPGDRRGFTTLQNQPVRTTSVKIIIESINAGAKWNDVGISEVRVLGK